ncbi:MAG: AAA family ATPase [Spirochaetales bacterium]|nr:AAA family ATPase [Spirochaetales bacterium]
MGIAISRIEIDGFRSIGDRLVLDLGALNALIGPNNSGKSNILLALRRVLVPDWLTVNSFSEDDVFRRDPNRDLTITVSFREPLKYEQFKGQFLDVPCLQFRYTTYKVGANKGERRLEKRCIKPDGKPVFERTQATGAPNFRPMTSIPNPVLEGIPLIYVAANRQVKDHLPGARGSLLGQLLGDIDRNLRQTYERVVIYGGDGAQELSRYEAFAHHISEALRLLRTSDFVAMENAIKRNALFQLGFDPDADSEKLDIQFRALSSMDFYRALRIYLQESPDFAVDAVDLGGGFQNAIVMAILKAFEEGQKKGAIFLIEEPELYLHPQMQRSLYKTLRRISETNQILYVTHSASFVAVPEYQDIVMVHKVGGRTRVRRSSMSAGAHVLEKLRKELDPTRSEMFFAARVLVVEGPTERLAFPEYASRMGLDLDQANATVVEAGGKRNLKIFAELAASFGIETGLLFDTDSSDFANKRDAEAEFNAELEGLRSAGIQVWSVAPNYEGFIRGEMGEAIYQSHCSRYPGVSKVVRARQMASDESIPIPGFVPPVLTWLCPAQARNPATQDSSQ